MDGLLLEKERRLSAVFQEMDAGAVAYDDICGTLSALLDSNVYILNAKGVIKGARYAIKSDSVAVDDPETDQDRLQKEYNDELLKVMNTKANFTVDEALNIFEYEYGASDKLHMAVPIVGSGRRIGTLIFTRRQPEFSEDDIILGEFAATVTGLGMIWMQTEERSEDERIRATVTKAIGTLSFSETLAMRQIFGTLKGSEGILITSKIADSNGITRSVIVNALRKLQSAGVVESRSLGMKGTYLRVLNNKLIDEIKKIK